jgi:cytochrome c oxidase assembly factor CtaG
VSGEAGLLLAGYTGPPELTAVRALTSWTLDWGGLALTALLGAPYLLGLSRLRGSGRGWPLGRALAYLAGLVVLCIATMSFLGAYAHVLFWVTAVQVALLVTVVPVLVSLGAPLSLLRAASPRLAGRADRFLASAPVRALTFPVVAAVLVAAVPFAVYFTPLFEASLRHGAVYWLLHAALVAAGLLFFWPVLAVDAEPRVPYPVLAVIVLVETLVDSVPGIVLWLGTGLLAPGYYRDVGRTWGRSLLSDQRFGGVMLWAIGEVVGLPLLALVVVGWVRADAREAAQVDAELDRAEAEAEAEARGTGTPETPGPS